MRGIESANRRLSRAVCGRSCGVFGLSPHGAVAGRAARAWPRVLNGAVLGLSITGDGASFNAASDASVATDVRWKKFTGILCIWGCSQLTCSAREALETEMLGRLLAWSIPKAASALDESSEGCLLQVRC